MAGKTQNYTHTKRMYLVNKLHNRITTALFILGFTSILIQLILIRELLNIFQGNELIIGIILSLWMLLTATGSGIAQHSFQNVGKNRLVSSLFVLEAIIPVIIVISLNLVDNLLFPQGTIRGLAIACVYCLIFLSPGCLISGFLFARLASLLSETSNHNYVSNAYGWESSGSMLAGIFFSLLVSFLLRTYQVIALCLLCNLVAGWLLYSRTQNKLTKAITFFVCLIAALLVFLLPVDLWIKSLHFKNERILFSRDTPFQNITVTESYGQVNFYGNNLLLFSSNNQYIAEEDVHYAMLQFPTAKNVLIVSGGIADMSVQVFKYKSIEKLHYLEIDPWLVKSEKKYTDIPDFQGMKIFNKDARNWIKNSNNRYDVIIINSPDPLNAQINRYYTLNFFREVKQALSNNGVFSISLSSTANYMSTEAREVNRIVFHTLQRAFTYVDIIPGGKNYFIASDNEVGLDIANRLQHISLENDYVTPYSIDDELMLLKNRQMIAEIKEPIATANTDLTPIAYLHQISYWLYMVEGGKSTLVLWIALIVIFILVIISLRKAKSFSIGVFTTGFAGASSEFLILIIYQSLFGNIYQMTGLIIALYMMGLTGGAMIHNKKGSNASRIYAVAQIAILLLVALIPVIFTLAIKKYFFPSWAIQSILFILITSIAFMSGLAFNQASLLSGDHFLKTAGNLYSIDLAGAALGTTITSLVLLPLAGIGYTCFTLAGVILAGLLISTIISKKSKIRLS